jgi:chemotaxis protein MotB
VKGRECWEEMETTARVAVSWRTAVNLSRTVALRKEEFPRSLSLVCRRRMEVKGTQYFLLGLSLVVWTLIGSGCGLERLKDSNRRLKEANNRLITENNRLEEELAGLHNRVSEKERTPPIEVAALTTQNLPPSAPATIETDLAKTILLDTGVDVDRTHEGIRITIPERVFFGLGQANLTSQGRLTLDRIARLIRDQYPNRMIRVDGHTDDTPIRKVRAKFPTNWELSTARACVVVRYLVDKGLNPHRVFPAGFSYYRPAATGPSDKSRNRRVEILVLDQSV